MQDVAIRLVWDVGSRELSAKACMLEQFPMSFENSGTEQLSSKYNFDMQYKF